MSPLKAGADQCANYLRAQRAKLLEAVKARYTRLIEEKDPPGPNSVYVATLDYLDDLLLEAVIGAVDDVGEAPE